MDGSAPTGSSILSSVSDAEMVRRFVVNDVKHVRVLCCYCGLCLSLSLRSLTFRVLQMSMERLVNDAKRLHALEDFYRVHHEAKAASSDDQC